MSALSIFNLKYVHSELVEVGLAASITGSGKAKLAELASMGTEIASELHGTREDVSKLRTAINRRAHDVKVSSIKAKSASAAIARLAREVHAVIGLVSDGVGVSKPMYDVGDFVVSNDWGFTESDVSALLGILSKVEGKTKILLEPLPSVAQVRGGVLFIDPTKAGVMGAKATIEASIKSVM